MPTPPFLPTQVPWGPHKILRNIRSHSSKATLGTFEDKDSHLLYRRRKLALPRLGAPHNPRPARVLLLAPGPHAGPGLPDTEATTSYCTKICSKLCLQNAVETPEPCHTGALRPQCNTVLNAPEESQR